MYSQKIESLLILWLLSGKYRIYRMTPKLDKSLDLQKAGQIKYVTFSYMIHMNAKFLC